MLRVLKVTCMALEVGWAQLASPTLTCGEMLHLGFLTYISGSKGWLVVRYSAEPSIRTSTMWPLSLGGLLHSMESRLQEWVSQKNKMEALVAFFLTQLQSPLMPCPLQIEPFQFRGGNVKSFPVGERKSHIVRKAHGLENMIVGFFWKTLSHNLYTKFSCWEMCSIIH